MEHGGDPRPGAPDDFDFTTTTPLPLLGSENPHRRQATSPAKNADHSGEAERASPGNEDKPAPNDTSACPGCFSSWVSSEPPVDGYLSVEESDSSYFDNSVPFPTAAHAAACRLESNLVGSDTTGGLRGRRQHRDGAPSRPGPHIDRAMGSKGRQAR